jgi:superfamily II DNA helicase RecQ
LHETRERIPDGLSEGDLPLLRDLVNVRHALSLEQHCPASQIISTSCLQRIAQWKPRTLAEMSSFAGFPVVQAERYGRFFADAVYRHAAAVELKRTELVLASRS